MERVKGIEPSYAAWEAAVLPLNYTRLKRSARPALITVEPDIHRMALSKSRPTNRIEHHRAKAPDVRSITSWENADFALSCANVIDYNRLKNHT